MDEEDNLDQQVALEPVEVEIQEPTDEAEMAEEVAQAEEEFYKNIAEDLDERVLGSLASQLISDYRKDKESRGDWEKGYT